jgi:hypothetical protein
MSAPKKSFREKVAESAWLDADLVALKVTENADKAKADRELAKQVAKIGKNRTRATIARVAK